MATIVHNKDNFNQRGEIAFRPGRAPRKRRTIKRGPGIGIPDPDVDDDAIYLTFGGRLRTDQPKRPIARPSA